MKVKFADNASKIVFLRNFHKFRPRDSMTYVRHDWTARQRAHDRALRNVLYDLRRKYTDVSIVIRDGVIIDKGTGRRFVPPPFPCPRPAGAGRILIKLTLALLTVNEPARPSVLCRVFTLMLAV